MYVYILIHLIVVWIATDADYKFLFAENGVVLFFYPIF